MVQCTPEGCHPRFLPNERGQGCGKTVGAAGKALKRKAFIALHKNEAAAACHGAVKIVARRPCTPANPSLPSSFPAIAMSTPVLYTIQAVQPAAHLFEVSLTLAQPDPAGQVFSLPAWIPGSYMIREFARNIVSLSAEAGG